MSSLLQTVAFCREGNGGTPRGMRLSYKSLGLGHASPGSLRLKFLKALAFLGIHPPRFTLPEAQPPPPLLLEVDFSQEVLDSNFRSEAMVAFI